MQSEWPFRWPYRESLLSANSYEYTGRQNDSTGYYYYRARYYNPQTGRFIAEDPLGFGGGDANIYRYAGGNPVNFRDPTGKCPPCLAALIAAELIEDAVLAEEAAAAATAVEEAAAAEAAEAAEGAAEAEEAATAGTRPPNMSPNGAGRRGALRQAKRDSNVPCSKQPDSTGPNVDRRGNPQPGRQYDYTDSNGNPAPIRDDAGGHEYPDDPSQNRGSHFNTPDGAHYDY